MFIIIKLLFILLNYRGLIRIHPLCIRAIAQYTISDFFPKTFSSHPVQNMFQHHVNYLVRIHLLLVDLTIKYRKPETYRFCENSLKIAFTQQVFLHIINK